MKFTTKWLTLINLLVVVLLALVLVGPAAIAQEDDEPTPTEQVTEEATDQAAEEAAGEGEPTPVPQDIATEFRISGASNLYKVTQAIANDFVIDYPNVEITVGVAGTAGGFDRFCTGENQTYFNNASRPIFESEAEICTENEVEWIELLVGYEGIVLAAHLDTAAEIDACLTMDQLAAMWAASAEPTEEIELDEEEAEASEEELPEPEPGITNWNQVDENFPDMELLLFGPDVTTAPADIFSMWVTGTAGDIRTDYTQNTNYQKLFDEMVGKPGSLGYFDFKFYTYSEEELIVLSVDAGDGCIAPTQETIASGDYPLARPLYLYLNAAALENPAVKAFAEFYFDDVMLKKVNDEGFYPAPAATYEKDRELITNAITGRSFSEAPPEPEPVATPEPEETEEDTESGEDETEGETETGEDESGADTEESGEATDSDE